MTTVLITGGHSGIGLGAARTLAARGVDLVLAGRSVERVRPTADDLSATYGVSTRTLVLDTSSLASTRAAAEEVLGWQAAGEVGMLDALVCNAGGRFDGPVTYSVDGYETTFATNCLGHFLLVDLLLPALSETGRVVYTASGTHDPDSLDGRLVGAVVDPDATALATMGRDGGEVLSAGKRYSTSKLCMVMYAYELDRRLRRSGSAVASIAYDPGSVAATGFLRDMPRPVQWLSNSRMFVWASRHIGITVSDVEFSGASLAALATAAEYADRGGEYFQANRGTLRAVRSGHLSYDRRRAARLWKDSRQLVHLPADEEPEVLK